MDEGGAHVHALLGHAVGQGDRCHIDHERKAGQDHYRPAFDRLRIEQPLDRLDDQEQADEDQPRQIEHGADQLGAAVPERMIFVGRHARDAPRDQRDAQRRGVGEVVDGVGDQGQAAGEHAADDLRHRQQDIDADGQQQPLIAAFGRR